MHPMFQVEPACIMGTPITNGWRDIGLRAPMLPSRAKVASDPGMVVFVSDFAAVAHCSKSIMRNLFRLSEVPHANPNVHQPHSPFCLHGPIEKDRTIHKSEDCEQIFFKNMKIKDNLKRVLRRWHSCNRHAGEHAVLPAALQETK